MNNMNMETLPKDKRGLRACMLCSLSQTQFRRDGCDNCEEILRLRDRPERVGSCTTQFFEGTIAMMNPDRSWVAKWQRVDSHVPGLYALKVNGRLPEEIEDELERRGMRYRPRDGTANDM
ncbi:transcription elongation factor spt4 [Blastocladiella emersonii ATCC 22665]|nr:transcription elongation factor spt4 [Blastocladiella emersonii ATCC 22665]